MAKFAIAFPIFSLYVKALQNKHWYQFLKPHPIPALLCIKVNGTEVNHWLGLLEYSLNLFFFFEFLNFILFIFLYTFFLVILLIHISVYMSIPISQFITPPPPPPPLSPLGVHTFVLYICVSISALQTGSSVPFF